MKKEGFSAEKFVKQLLEEGVKVSCDETNDSFKNNQTLPPFYDETLYKRGQKFFYYHLWGFFFSKFMGLLTVLTIVPSLRILVLTGRSGSNLTAYRRYLSTIFHMCVWYDEDFKPDSRLWKSIKYVRSRHNAASKLGNNVLSYGISQCDMAYTQFGFMGISLCRPEMVGIHHAKDEDWEGFVHLWRVVGYLMGIDDRFNICRESVQETREICDILMSQVFKPAFEERQPEFLEMASYLVNGLWSFCPFLRFKVFLSYLYMVMRNSDDTKELTYFKLDFFERIRLNITIATARSTRFSFWRIFHNTVQNFSVWLMKVFPFLAYYQFGKSKSHVVILDDYKKVKYK